MPPMAGISLDAVNIIAIWVEAILYGLYLVLFSFTFHILYYPRFISGRRHKVNLTLLSACSVLFILSTIHLGAGLRTLLEAFVFWGKGRDEGTIIYFSEQGMPLNVLRNAIVAASNLLSDSLLTYRCYVLWHRNLFVIIFPILSFLAAITAIIFIAKNLVHFDPSFETGIFTPSMNIWVPTYFGVAFATSLYLTICIAWKLWRAAGKAGREQLQFKRLFSTIVFIESNSLFPLTTFLAFIFFLAGSNMQVVPVNALAQIIVITPTLMVLQIQTGVYSSRGDARDDRDENGSSRKDSEPEPDMVTGHMDTDFTAPYHFILEPETSGVHFPSLFRTMSMKTFKDRKSATSSKKEGRVGFTKYNGIMGIYPINYIFTPETNTREKKGIVVTSSVDIYDITAGRED